MIAGMDFGTTHSGIARYDGRHLHTVPLNLLNQSETVTPTTLYVLNEQKVHFGAEAVDTYFHQNLGRPVRLERVWVGEIEQTFAEVGTFVKDVYIWVDVLSPGRLFLSFKTDLSDASYVGTAVGRFFYRLEDIIAIYLFVAKQRAEQVFGCELTEIVLGRPVHFSMDDQANHMAQERLLNAAFRAGYKTVYFEYEPIAAAYHFERSLTRSQNVLVFDFGGGTLDVTIVRMGDPANRCVLATGGVPIAGDVFDRRLLRAKIPKHFGENTTYRSVDKDLPIPKWIFDAFADWRTILSLQTPETLGLLRTIAPSAAERSQIEALISLVSSNYSFKMFEVIERVKRQLSDRKQAKIRLGGPGFTVDELVTRTEFERIIMPEYREIENHLNDTVRQSGLTSSQIDVVVRTGGSSQIPLFQRMLTEKFGEEKVRAIDTFGSVTSGLGIIAHEVGEGRLDKKAYTQSKRVQSSANAETNLPPINLELIMAQVKLQEQKTYVIEKAGGDSARVGTEPASSRDLASEWGYAALTSDYELSISALPPTFDQDCRSLNAAEVHIPQATRLLSLTRADFDEPLLLVTSAFRFLLVTLRELLTYQDTGATIRELHGFDRAEQICTLNRWNELKRRELMLIVSTQGMARKIKMQQIGPRIEGTTPPRIDWSLGGWPRVVCAGEPAQDLLILNSMARASRIKLARLPVRGGRVIAFRKREQIVQGLCIGESGTYPSLLLLSTAGFGKILDPSTVKLSLRPGAESVSVARRRGEINGVTSHHRDVLLWVLTNKRLTPVSVNPKAYQESLTQAMHPMLKLSRGEQVLSLLT